ncbi:TIGR04141 family sporadically distributed protein [Amycolatopsis sp. CA-230715]|uniref:TIGR04141 family sporadically distributed protein n=1 Tax=Amycolatopsis sp. CA-230715 TaxID=2745196 RepID=UPI001C019EC0|nr:DUF6119 family protein [Amycolatopsis sp. CA-230715]QWF81874.1 hypothetical protein HUW46_05307 [Amycolatopsis sp. CA-230715]
MAPKTSKHTLYRLTGVVATSDGLLRAVDDELFDEISGSFEVPPAFTALGIEALAVTGAALQDEAEWCAEFRRTTGVDCSQPNWRGSGLLLLAVDGEVYAIGYGQGFRLLQDRFKDKSFGLAFALRAVDPNTVHGIRSRVLGRGRTDITMVAGGAPVGSLGIREFQRIVDKVAGEICDVELTGVRHGKGKLVKVGGGLGLELPLGVDPKELLADIREISRVCREVQPDPALEFVEHVVQVSCPDLLKQLDTILDNGLGDPGGLQITPSVPGNLIEECAEARQWRMRIGSTGWHESDEFDFGYALDRARAHRMGRRVWALREQSEVEMFRWPGGQFIDRLAKAKAIRFLETNVSIGSRRFYLTDGTWYELGEQYQPEIVRTVTRVINPDAVNLPAWQLHQDEAAYNYGVPNELPAEGYLCLDRRNVSNPLKSRNSLEICDLLAPGNTLIMVKRAHGSSALSHLFHQGLVAVQMLQNSAQVRKRFAEKVSEVSKGRVTISESFVPERVVFAILLKKGEQLTPDTLFAFSQVALAQTVKLLEEWGVRVEVIGIEAEASQGIPAEAA